jgi:DNA-directed RNA polymerase subunit RPC12/RpoP
VRETIKPMSLANMRANGVRAVIAACEACGHKADVIVDAMPETTFVPEGGRRLRCTACGGKRINTRPAWHTARNAFGQANS